MNHVSEPIQVLVRSRQVPVQIVQVEVPYPTLLGQIPLRTRFVRYERRLDPEQQAILQAARTLAWRTGAPLEVTDVAQERVFARVFRQLGRLVAGAPRVSLPASLLPDVVEQQASVR